MQRNQSQPNLAFRFTDPLFKCTAERTKSKLTWTMTISLSHTSSNSIVGLLKANHLFYQKFDCVLISCSLPWIDINSVFVNLSLYVTTNGLPPHLRAYTSVFLESFFNLPLNKADGTQVPYEDVVRQLNEDTIHHNATLGVRHGFRELIAVSIKVEVSVRLYNYRKREGGMLKFGVSYISLFHEREIDICFLYILQSKPQASKYKKAIKWIEDMLWNTEFTVERLVFQSYYSHDLLFSTSYNIFILLYSQGWKLLPPRFWTTFRSLNAMEKG